MNDFEDYLVEAMKKKSEEVIQEVAVEFVRMINGDWDLAIAIDKNETKQLKDCAIDELTADAIRLGIAEDAEDTKAELKTYRLRWSTTF